MIALVDELPLLQFADGSVFTFRRAWLRQNLLTAAERAGYRDWWFADHVVASIAGYLTLEYEASVLPAGDLERSVIQVLGAIGYADIADHFRPYRPAREISLLEIARASSRHELTFFSLLRQTLQTEIQEGATSATLIHLAPAIKEILGLKLFTGECACLRDEIVAFSRQTAAASSLALLIR